MSCVAFEFKKKGDVVTTPQPQRISTEMPHIVVAYNKLHKGMLFGHISNGGGQIAIDRNYALKFIVDGSQFVQIELVQYGVRASASTQSYNRTKTVVEKVEVARKPRVQQGEELVVSEVVQTEELF